VVALRTGGGAIYPFAGEAEIAGALPADVVSAEVGVEGVGVGEDAGAGGPFADVLLRRWRVGAAGGGGVGGRDGAAVVGW
jgi:hypothetical protein